MTGSFVERGEVRPNRERDALGLKGLELVRPDYARILGLIIEEPVFISEIDSTESRPPVYQVGITVKVSFFDPTETGPLVTKHKVALNTEVPLGVRHSRPQYGMGYEECPTYLTPTDRQFLCLATSQGNWVAVVEPLGRVKEDKDYMKYFDRSTDELRVREILAFCKAGCPSTKPLREGLVVDTVGNGFLYPFCSSEKHRKAIVSQEMPWFRFFFDQAGRVNFDYSAH